MKEPVALTPEPEYGRRLVPSPFAGIVSLLVPGLGHALAGAYRRGMVLFFSMATILGLMTWRIKLASRRETEILEIIKKAYRLQPLLLILSIAVIALYLWIAVDAYASAARKPKSTAMLFGLVVLTFFGLGWQIGEIDPVRLITGLDEGGEKLTRVMWPWKRAITREPFIVGATSNIQVPCSDNPPPESTIIPDEPSLVVSPTCGRLSEQDGSLGSPLKVIGTGFVPNTETDLVWEDPISNEFRQRQGGEYIAPFADAEGNFEVDIIMPYRLMPPSISTEPQMWKLHARQVVSLGPPKASIELKLAIERMVETIFLGMMATFFGIILAIPISFLAARNLMSASWITLAVYWFTRTILNIIRSIEPLIWAIIAVVVVGLGPFAGILALTLHTIAALGKLYSEAIESIERGPIEAIQATGASWVQIVMFAVIPQIVPPFVSFTIYRWDINVRMSTIIGLVGGGGIGFLLIQWIRLLDYRAAGIAVWFIAITVALLDYISAEIRRRFI